MQPKKTPNINPLSPYVCTCTFFKGKLHKVQVIVLNQDDLSGNVTTYSDVMPPVLIDSERNQALQFTG